MPAVKNSTIIEGFETVGEIWKKDSLYVIIR